tara:strand:+ start:195 stop:881 length:687 start_codon:yes stop_codon:yes gene_type:complete
MLKYILIFFIVIQPVFSFENSKIDLGNFLINKYEITIKEFKQYADQNKIKTKAELNGGGYEWGAGWVKRDNWFYFSPYGKKPESVLEPAVHINKFEAENYCKSINGRLPTFEEWSLGAYKQVIESKKFSKGKTYKYPSGDEAIGMNSQGLLDYNKHIDVTKLPEGINGLVAMGGNVWEWVDDQKNNESLTAGASWWYDGRKTSKEGAQYKPSDFFAIYVGFRCVFDKS